VQKGRFGCLDRRPTGFALFHTHTHSRRQSFAAAGTHKSMELSATGFMITGSQLQ